MGDPGKYRSHLNDGRRETARPPTFSLARAGSFTVCLTVDAGARTAAVHLAGQWPGAPQAAPGWPDDPAGGFPS